MDYTVIMSALVMLKEVDRRRHMDEFNLFGPFHEENSNYLMATKADKERPEINISVCQAQCG